MKINENLLWNVGGLLSIVNGVVIILTNNLDLTEGSLFMILGVLCYMFSKTLEGGEK